MYRQDFLKASASRHLPATADDVGRRLVLQMSDVLVAVHPHLVTDPASAHPVGCPGPAPHVAEAPAGHGRDAAEVCGGDGAVEVAVIWGQKGES